MNKAQRLAEIRFNALKIRIEVLLEQGKEKAAMAYLRKTTGLEDCALRTAMTNIQLEILREQSVLEKRR